MPTGAGAGVSSGISSAVDMYTRFQAMKAQKENQELQREIMKMREQELKFQMQEAKLKYERQKMQREQEPLFYQQMMQMAQPRGYTNESMGSDPGMGMPPQGAAIPQPPEISAAPASNTPFSDQLFSDSLAMPQQSNAQSPLTPAPLLPGMIRKGAEPQLGPSNQLPNFLGTQGPSSALLGGGLTANASPASLTGGPTALTPVSNQLLGRSDVGYDRQQLAKLLELADKSGNWEQFTYAVEQGIVPSPQFEMSRMQDILKGREFEQKLEKAQLDLRQQQARNEIGQFWLKQGNEGAGIAALGGDFASALKLAYPELATNALSKATLINRALDGDTRAVEILDMMQAIEMQTAQTVSVGADGSVSISQGGIQPVVYPAQQWMKDQEGISNLKLGMGTIDDLFSIVDTNPQAVGTPGFISKVSGFIKYGLGSLIGGERGKALQEKAYGENATAAAQYEALGEVLAAYYAKGELGNVQLTTPDIIAAKNALGISGGWLSLVTAPEAITKLTIAKKKFQDRMGEVSLRRQRFEKEAPRAGNAPNSWTRMLNRHGLGGGNRPAISVDEMPNSDTVKALNGQNPDGSTIRTKGKPKPKAQDSRVDEMARDQVSNMTPEQRQAEYQRLKAKQAAGKATPKKQDSQPGRPLDNVERLTPEEKEQLLNKLRKEQGAQ